MWDVQSDVQFVLFDVHLASVVNVNAGGGDPGRYEWPDHIEDYRYIYL